MTPARVDDHEEVRRLQGCLNDLISVMALPALWSGRGPMEIVEALLDGLVRILRLDFAYARLTHGFDGASRESLRTLRAAAAPLPLEVIGERFMGLLRKPPFTSREAIASPVGEGQVHVVHLPLGLLDSIGVLVVGSERADFPTRPEEVVLRVAANQAAIGLQEARRLHEQQRAGRELEKGVVERTAQLSALNAELRAEVEERHRAQADLVKLASLVQHSDDFIGFADLDGRLLFLNTAGRELVGLRDDGEEHSIHVSDFAHGDDRSRVAAEIWPAVLANRRWDGEICFRHFATGAPIPMHQHVFLIEEPHGERPRVVATISRDITERKAAEQALAKAREDIAHVSRVTTMGELTASIAHEVNQPLAAIVTNANACVHWLAATPANMDEARTAAQRIIRDANRASEVIMHIRAFLTRGKPLKTPLRLEQVIADVAGLVLEEAREKGVALEVSAAPDLPDILGDRIQLQQVLLNLIINGIEAMAGVNDRPRTIAIGVASHDAREVRLSVGDSGPGLDPKDMERVFDMFYTTKPRGMGMGLSISRSIVESHGGRLWVEPNEGTGLKFLFTLPVKAEPIE
jgi:PAS domain S-box-containing protein